jgi:hypothetical protein
VSLADDLRFGVPPRSGGSPKINFVMPYEDYAELEDYARKLGVKPAVLMREFLTEALTAGAAPEVTSRRAPARSKNVNLVVPESLHARFMALLERTGEKKSTLARTVILEGMAGRRRAAGADPA